MTKCSSCSKPCEREDMEGRICKPCVMKLRKKIETYTVTEKSVRKLIKSSISRYGRSQSKIKSIIMAPTDFYRLWELYEKTVGRMFIDYMKMLRMLESDVEGQALDIVNEDIKSISQETRLEIASIAECLKADLDQEAIQREKNRIAREGKVYDPPGPGTEEIQFKRNRYDG